MLPLPWVGCEDCGLDYQDFPLDVVLTNEQWAMIHHSEGGLLCAGCIVARVSRLPHVINCRLKIVFGEDYPGNDIS